MNTVYVVVASSWAALTLISLLLARVVPDEYDLGQPRAVLARSRVMRVRQ